MVHDNSCDCADEQQDARGRLDEESGQALLHRLGVAGGINDAADDPDESERRSDNVAEVNRAQPERQNESRHPFERVDVHAIDAFEIRIARHCRKIDFEPDVRRRDPRCEEEIQCDGEQCDDRGVKRHSDVLCSCSERVECTGAVLQLFR